MRHILRHFVALLRLFFSVSRVNHQISGMEAGLQVLQHVGVPPGHRPLRGRHVPHGLEDRPHHFWHRLRPLFLHQLPKTRGQLVKLAINVLSFVKWPLGGENFEFVLIWSKVLLTRRP